MLFLRKNILALTGLFLCLFLVVHLAGNLILLLPAKEAHVLYNTYSHTLSENILIKAVSFILYLSLLLHTIYATLVIIYNRKARGEAYQVNHKYQNSTWTSQNMGLLGFLILIFIVIHMAQLWARVKLGIGAAVPLDLNGHKDVYLITIEVFKNPWMTLFYSILMIPLGLHLAHGISSALKTLGLYSKYYLKITKIIAVLFSVVVSIGFFIIPIVIYFRG